MTTLMKASEQWANRPADERYPSLEAMHAAVLARRQRAGTARLPFAQLHAIARDGAVMLNGRTDTTAALTHHAFGQLAARAGAPAAYLRQLPATLAADCLNQSLTKRVSDGGDGDALILFDRDAVQGAYAGDTSRDTLTARALTTDRYTRIWDADITARLLRVKEQGWQEAPAAFDGSRGMYASDSDLFAFMVDNERRIFERGPGGGLSRGFFAWNSEVGAASFGVMTFLYEFVCGNHRVWGASQVKELRVRHVGNADERAFRELTISLREYAAASASDDEAIIERARTTRIAVDKDALLDRIFGLKVPGVTRKVAEASYQLAEAHADWYGDPLTVWGFNGGLTEYARDLPHADERVAIERASGKLMEVAF